MKDALDNTNRIIAGRTAENAILEVHGLSASYGDVSAISDIDIAIQRGEIVCIVGESGSGKSTLLKSIQGIGGPRITKGRVLIAGREITGLRPAEKHRLMVEVIGLIPQDPGASFNPIRRFDSQFREVFAGHGIPYDEEKVIALLEKTGLTDVRRIMRTRPYEMSGGMNQRIAVASAMLFSPKLLLCDEATSSLDVTTAELVVEELVRARDEYGTSILMVTHDLGIAGRMADRIDIMKDGRIIESGTADKIFESPEEEYTKKLMADLQEHRRFNAV